MSGPAHPNLKYARQVDAGPPTFVLLCTRAAKSSAAYMAFVTNSLRKTFRLHGVPLRVHLRDANALDRRDRRDVPERRGGAREAAGGRSPPNTLPLLRVELILTSRIAFRISLGLIPWLLFAPWMKLPSELPIKIIAQRTPPWKANKR